MGQIIRLNVVPAGYPDTSTTLDPAEGLLLSAIRWWVADFRQRDDPLPRLCGVMGAAGAHDAAFSVDQLMAVFVRSARRPMAVHCPPCPRTKSICSMPQALCRLANIKWRSARCVPRCSRLKARNSRLAPCTGWVICSPRPDCSSARGSRPPQARRRPWRRSRGLPRCYRRRFNDRWGVVMERHLSTGVATIVALMAAHRGASGEPATYCQEAVARIDAYLHDNEPGPAPAATSIHARQRGRVGIEIQRS
jgi:hypothetical protein